MAFKLPPFVGCVIALFGFSEEDTKDMEAILIQNGMVLFFHHCTWYINRAFT